MSQEALLAFRAAAQLELEATWPAVIKLPGYADPLTCAGGTIRENNTKAILGGIVGDYAVFFRVRLELLTGKLPEVGTLFEFAERKWRIDRTVLPTSDAVVCIGGNVPSKQS